MPGVALKRSEPWLLREPQAACDLVGELEAGDGQAQAIGDQRQLFLPTKVIDVDHPGIVGGEAAEIGWVGATKTVDSLIGIADCCGSPRRRPRRVFCDGGDDGQWV
jgi:hypothetical protein